MEKPSLLKALLEEMIHENGSDLYINVGIPPCLRIGDRILPMRNTPLTATNINEFVQFLLNDKQADEFKNELEMNMSFPWDNRARFRANFFRQQEHTGIVIRRINTQIPTPEELKLHHAYKDLIMLNSGLVLVVGKAGSGKSTSLAAMIGHRNEHGFGHVLTVEDPIEYIHTPKHCLFTQRDVGIDTHSYAEALRNALRQRPDIVLIGEIRDTEVMEQAIGVAETGHLCLATLHAHNAPQTIERIVDMFPEDRHHQIYKSLAQQLRGVVAQRLIDNVQGGKTMIAEIMLNEGGITTLIEEGRLKEIKEIMQRSRGQGMQTFDQDIMDQYAAGNIDKEIALRYSDHPTDLALKIRQFESESNQRSGRVDIGTNAPGFGVKTEPSDSGSIF